MVPTHCKRFILQNKPVGEVKLGNGSDATWKLEDYTLPELKNGQALLQVLYLGNDPAQKGWIDAAADPRRSYLPPVQEGEPMRGGQVLAKVVATKGDGPLQQGDIVVIGLSNWSEYLVMDQSECRKAEKIDGAPLTAYMSTFGGVALTAYFALTEVIDLKKGEEIIISGAAGAVGSIAVQLAKHVLGAKRVIAIAGSEEKCRWLESLGADATINYKTPGWEKRLAEATPDFCEACLDNVGGDMLSTILTRMKSYGRLGICGCISNYNKETQGEQGVCNWSEIMSCRLRLRGFIFTDFMPKFGKAHEVLLKAFKEGKLKAEGGETIVDARGHFERVPEIWNKLFSGGNQGKLITQLADV